jgi:very-short-patch-repair endonuclease
LEGVSGADIFVDLHFTKGQYDVYRQKKLEELGYTVIRFNEGDVINNFPSVDEKNRHTIYCLKSGT